MPAPEAPFSRIKTRGKITIDGLSGTGLILHTGSESLLPSYNEFRFSGKTPLPRAGAYSLTNDFDINTGILLTDKRWIAIPDVDSSSVYFFWATKPFSTIEFSTSEGESLDCGGSSVSADSIVDGKDSASNAYLQLDGGNSTYNVFLTQLKLSSVNGVIYYGIFKYSDLSKDSNSDSIPDYLDSSLKRSLVKFLYTYSAINKLSIDNGSSLATNTLLLDGGESSETENILLIDGGNS